MTLQAALNPDADVGRWLPLALQAGIVYLAVLVLAGCMVSGAVAERWRDELQRRLTVQLANAGDGDTRDTDIAAALARLRADHEIESAEPVPQARLVMLLQRTLGPAANAPDLFPPAVIEVVVAPQARDRLPAIAARLRNDLPRAAVAAVEADRDTGLRMVRTMQSAGLLALLVLAATLIAAVVFSTRLRLSVQRPALEVLLQLGAEDRAVLQAETVHALRTALLAAGIGLLTAMGTLLSLAAMIVATPFATLLAPSPLLVNAGLLIVPPLAAILLATLAARLTVRRVVTEYPW